MNMTAAIEALTGKALAESTDQEIYLALLDIVREQSAEKVRPVTGRKLYYISAEFLIGKLLSNNLINLGLYDDVRDALAAAGKNLSDIEEVEPEPSLGNGGLGRLAACFLDSLATLNLPGDGVGLRYHFGLFHQSFAKGVQNELPDPWLTNHSWAEKTDVTYPVELAGKEYTARLYKLAVTGYEGRTNTLNLFDLDTIDETIVHDGIQFDKTDIDKKVNHYDYNPEKAVELLKQAGFVYNADGSDYVDGSGEIRYKKVTEVEAGTYAHNVTLADGTILMPLIIEWSSSENNPVSELLNVMLAQGEQTANAGMKINQNVMTFTELLNYYYRDASQGDKYAVPTYGMFNLATNFNPAFDQSYEWTLDPAMVAQGYNLNRLYNETLDAITMNMVYGVDSENTSLYMTYWKAFEMLWNELLPQVPLYSNIYITVYPDWLENYTQDSFWDFQQAILYATVAE